MMRPPRIPPRSRSSSLWYGHSTSRHKGERFSKNPILEGQGQAVKRAGSARMERLFS